MKANVRTLDNKAKGEIALNPAVFGLPARADLLSRMVQYQLAKRQAGTHKTKEIGDVSGTTAKPFKQKGTGNARQGSRRSPQFKGGATIFGPVVRSHAHDLPKKVRKLALKTALSVKLADGSLHILEDLVASEPKTAAVLKSIQGLGLNSVLFIAGDVVDVNFKKAVANIKGADVLPQIGANVYDILQHKDLVLTREAVERLEERLA